MKKILFLIALFFGLAACTSNNDSTDHESDNSDSTLEDSINKEVHLSNIKQLTFGGDNAEAYFSYDDSKLVFQSNYTTWNVSCDQIFFMDIEEASNAQINPPMISTGKGRTTCSYFLPGDSLIVYASTHEGGDACPEEKSLDGKYVWNIFKTYDIYVADLEGNIVKKLTNEPGYDAEATVSPQGDKIVFTSDRTGDLELYTMNIDGSDVKQITTGLGYDGGAFFSPNGKQLVFRSSRPKTEEEIKEYKDLLAQGLVAPTNMEIYICNVDGSNLKQITSLGKANWAPFFHPSGEKIIFSSNHASTGRGYNFQLYMVDTTGNNLEQITHESEFNAFPMFSYKGNRLVFSSNRNNGGTHDTNLFIADWED